eukprot:scaffold48420_cov247-Isochrysis_galbana.AAC.2
MATRVWAFVNCMWSVAWPSARLLSSEHGSGVACERTDASGESRAPHMRPTASRGSAPSSAEPTDWPSPPPVTISVQATRLRSCLADRARQVAPAAKPPPAMRLRCLLPSPASDSAPRSRAPGPSPAEPPSSGVPCEVPSGWSANSREATHTEDWRGLSHQRRLCARRSAAETGAAQAVSLGWQPGTGQPAGVRASSLAASLTTS